MKKIKYLLFTFGFMLCMIPDVKALDYVYDIKYAGISPGTTISIDANTNYTGNLYFEEPITTYDDYLLVSYCATQDVSVWFDGHDAIQMNSNESCGVWGVSGTMQFAYFPIDTWSFTDTTVYYSTSNSRFENTNSTYAYLTLYSVTTSSSIDLSLAILAYLQSQEKDINYTDALAQIQENQSDYVEEIGIVQDKLEETNTSINEMKDALTNSDVTDDTGSSFFDNFSVTDNGGISAIVTAPLSAIEKMVSGTCTPIEGSYKGKEFSFPCGDTFWAEMPDVKKFLNIVLGGFLCYGILAKLYLLIDRLKDPEDDRVDVMKL